MVRFDLNHSERKCVNFQRSRDFTSGTVKFAPHSLRKKKDSGVTHLPPPNHSKKKLTRSHTSPSPKYLYFTSISNDSLTNSQTHRLIKTADGIILVRRRNSRENSLVLFLRKRCESGSRVDTSLELFRLNGDKNQISRNFVIWEVTPLNPV